MPVRTQGAEAAEQLYLASRKGTGRLDFFRMKDGDPQVVLRLATDLGDWDTADVHQFIPTKTKPADGGDKWPKTMWGVCQNDLIFKLRDAHNNPTSDFETGYGNCYIHTAYAGKLDAFKKDMSVPARQTFAIGVLREPVRDPVTNKITGFADQTMEWTGPDSTKHRVPKFVLISQKYSNFYAPIKQAAFVDGIVTNKDFLIKRDGNDYDVQSINVDPPGTDQGKVYADALEMMGVSTWQIILDHASPEHYSKFFIPGEGEAAAPALTGEDAADTTETEAPATGDEPGAEDLAAFAARLHGGAKEPAAAGS